MGEKINKVKTFLTVFQEVADAFMDATEKIDTSISSLNKEDGVLYGVKRFDKNGNIISLCSIQNPNGTWHYYKSIDNGFRVAFNYYNSMPTQKELDKMKA